ncbi:hypothetical protein [Lentzea sp. NPDC055074]
MGDIVSEWEQTYQTVPEKLPQAPPENTGDWNGAPGQYYANTTRPPAVPRNDESGKGDIRVNTAALKLFAENLLLLKGIVEPLLDELKTVNLRPGRFYDAGQLIGKVSGTVSITNTTRKYLETVINLFVTYAEGLQRLVLEYSTTEELNEVTAAELAEFVANAQTYLNQALGGPTGLPTDTTDDPTGDPTGDPISETDPTTTTT